MPLRGQPWGFRGRPHDAPSSCALTKGARRVLRGLTRQAACEGRTPRQAAALTEEGLAAIRATAHLRRTGPSGRIERASTAHLRGQVDIVARVGHAGRTASALRSCRAHLGRHGVSERRVRPRHRPPLQERPGRHMGSPCTSGESAAMALLAIHRPDASPKARVFGLRSGRAVSNRIAKAAKGRRAEAGRFSGHSPRIGMARDLVASGAGRRRRPGRRTLGLAPDAVPTTPAPNWPGTARSPGSTARSDPAQLTADAGHTMGTPHHGRLPLRRGLAWP